MSQQTYDANSVLMGGGGAPTAKFANPGDTLVGRIIAPPQVYQERDYDPNNPGGGKPKTYPSGDPIMAVYVDLATDARDPGINDDDGTRRFYIEGRYLKGDVRDAIRRVGANGLEVGGLLRVSFTHREDPMDKRSRKFWAVEYTPAGNAALMTPDPAPAQVQFAAGGHVGGQPVPHTAAPVSAPQTQPYQPPTPIPAPAPAAVGGPTAADKAKQLIAVGLDDTTIAAAVGLDASVIAILRAA